MEKNEGWRAHRYSVYTGFPEYGLRAIPDYAGLTLLSQA